MKLNLKKTYVGSKYYIISSIWDDLIYNIELACLWNCIHIEKESKFIEEIKNCIMPYMSCTMQGEDVLHFENK